MLRVTGLIFFITVSLFAKAQDGKLIFQQRCAACHKIGKRFVGPDLQNVHLRRDSVWLVKFIHSSQSMIKSGDTAAINVFNAYNKVVMPDQNLTDAEINAVMTHIKSFSASAQAENTAVTEPADKTPPGLFETAKDEKESSPEERSRNLVIFFNKGAIVSLIAIAMLFAILNLILISKFKYNKR